MFSNFRFISQTWELAEWILPFKGYPDLRSVFLTCRILLCRSCLLSSVLTSLQVWWSEYTIEPLRLVNYTDLSSFCFSFINGTEWFVSRDFFKIFFYPLRKKKNSSFISYKELSCDIKTHHRHNYIFLVCIELSSVSIWAWHAGVFLHLYHSLFFFFESLTNLRWFVSEYKLLLALCL